MPIPDLDKIVASLDGEMEPTDTLEDELKSIALPPLFRSDDDEWLDVELLRSSLTASEVSLISNQDADYISELRRQQRDNARLLKVARETGTLAQAPGVFTSPARRTYWELSRLRRDADRTEKVRKFSEKLRADLDSPDAALHTFLQATNESFIWRPGTQQCREFLPGDESRAAVGQLIGAPVEVDDVFIEVAYYWGILYNIFPKDRHPSPLVIRTDHETSWEPYDICSSGSLNEFLSGFLDVASIVATLAEKLR